MKQSFLSRFTRFVEHNKCGKLRSAGCAPVGWPTDDVAEIDASANELKKITADILKKLTLYLPPASSSTLRSLDLTPFHSDSLQLSGSSGDRLANKATKLEETRHKLFPTHNNHQPEYNGFSPCSNDTKSQERDLNAEGDSGSYEASSSKEASKNGESSETRFFANGTAMFNHSNVVIVTTLFFHGTQVFNYLGLRLCNPTWHAFPLVGRRLPLLMPKLIIHPLTHDLEPANHCARRWPIDQQPRTGARLRLLAHAPTWVPPRTCTCVVLLGERQNASMTPQRIYRLTETFLFPAEV
ncbi:hypothetical protein TSMEX_008014 [Taenia solium]|eukprot:TsM_000946200 transcript=TsM_000946200 gene=TsM_000946200